MGRCGPRLGDQGATRARVGRSGGAVGEEMSENERRAADQLTAQDLVIRAASAIGLIMAALTALLAIQPA